MHTAMILGAGLGTRLRPLTDELPKPLVPIGDRSVLAHVAAKFRELGVQRIVINTHHLADKYDLASLQDALGMEVVLSHEEKILGTAGGIGGARDHFGDGPVLVHNGDILADVDMARLVELHELRDALATLAVIGGAPAGEGPVGLDRSGEIIRLRNESFGDEHEGAQFIGVHVVSPSLLPRLPSEGCMVGDVYMPMLRDGERIAAAKVARSFTDIGTLRAYLDANMAWLEQSDAACYRGPNAMVADGIELSESIVGAGASIIGQGALVRCVIWPEAHAKAPLSNVIVTTSGEVVPVPKVKR